MGWKERDLFEFEVERFESQINEVVVPLFDATEQRLTEWDKEVDVEFDEAMCKARHEADETNAAGEATIKGMRLDEQRELLGAAYLGYMATALKECLDDMARYFENSHPPDREYVGKSWLQKRQVEYQQRFQIDFTKAPFSLLASMEELVLARNAGLHWDGSALEEYRRKVANPRFIRYVDDSFTVDRDNFLKTISEVRAFVAWVHAELKKLRSGHSAVQS